LGQEATYCLHVSEEALSQYNWIMLTRGRGRRERKRRRNALNSCLDWVVRRWAFAGVQKKKRTRIKSPKTRQWLKTTSKSRARKMMPSTCASKRSQEGGEMSAKKTCEKGKQGHEGHQFQHMLWLENEEGR
jgi:hypothetical protein